MEWAGMRVSWWQRPRLGILGLPNHFMSSILDSFSMLLFFCIVRYKCQIYTWKYSWCTGDDQLKPLCSWAWFHPLLRSEFLPDFNIRIRQLVSSICSPHTFFFLLLKLWLVFSGSQCNFLSQLVFFYILLSSGEWALPLRTMIPRTSFLPESLAFLISIVRWTGWFILVQNPFLEKGKCLYYPFYIW